MAVNSSNFADLADELRVAAIEHRPHEETLYFSVQRLCFLSLTENPSWMRQPIQTTCMISESIGNRLNGVDAIDCKDLPYWSFAAEKLAAVLDAIASGHSESAILALIGDLSEALSPKASHGSAH